MKKWASARLPWPFRSKATEAEEAKPQRQETSYRGKRKPPGDGLRGLAEKSCHCPMLPWEPLALRRKKTKIHPRGKKGGWEHAHRKTPLSSFVWRVFVSFLKGEDFRGRLREGLNQKIHQPSRCVLRSADASKWAYRGVKVIEEGGTRT